MIRSFVLAFAITFWGGAAFAQSIEDVITRQLQAFNDRDVDAAFQDASPMIKGMFQTPENFGNMVRNGYPMVWDNAAVRFLDREPMGPVTRQEILIQGPDGVFYILDYQMIETPDGWQINGVQVIPAPDILS